MTTKKMANNKPTSKSVAFVYRPDSPAALKLARTLTTWLKSQNYHVLTAPDQKKINGTDLLQRSSALEKMAMIIVLGGDGTYLRAVRMLEGKPVPVLGINLGSLGFLTMTKSSDALNAVKSALENKMQLRPRAMLKINIKRKNKKTIEMLALNDVVIERGSLSQLINVAIHMGKDLVSDVKADGLVIASPTGSTAYNLAAGGPITHPLAQILIVTPISPHSLTSRPLIFSDETKLSFFLVGKKQKAHLVIDGQKIIELTADDRIQVSKSSMTHYLVKDPNQSYFHVLREKLRFGERA